MFCPKCGSQNIDEARFCRGCGIDLSNVMAAIDGKPTPTSHVAEKQIDLFSTGVRNVVMAFGFAALAFVIALIPGDTHFWVLFLIPAFILLASGISRIIKAQGLKELRETEKQRKLDFREVQALPPGESDYIKPQVPVYKTEDLLHARASVTEGTTRNLEKKEGVIGKRPL
jgi:zinc-ribbon domain